MNYLNPINLIQILQTYIGIRIRNRRLKQIRATLINKNFTILTENCLAGMIYHDLKMQFCSPLINGEFSTEDYLKFLQNPQYYMQQELIFISYKDNSIPKFYQELDCPVACIGDLHFRFTHYHISEDKIYDIWNRRKARINWDNIFVVLCEKKGCTLKHMEEFESLPYKNKLILTSRNYPQLKHSFHIKGFEKLGYIDNLLKDMPGIFPSSKKYYEQLDWISWLNKGKIQRA